MRVDISFYLERRRRHTLWATDYEAYTFLHRRLTYKICHIEFKIILFRGTEEFHGILGRIDIINSTLGKALGGASGGYTTGPKQLIDLLRQKSRPYLFSNSLPPAVVGTGIKVRNISISIKWWRFSQFFFILFR